MGRLAIVEINGVKQYQYVDTYEIQDAQVSQQGAGYNPLGATDVEGCANCNWFLGPSRCVVVQGDISPTGLSSLWRAKEPFVMAPILVQIVGTESAGIPASDPPVTGAKDHPVVAEHPRTVPDDDPKDPKGPGGVPKKKKPAAGYTEPSPKPEQTHPAAKETLLERATSALKSVFASETAGARATLGPVHPAADPPEGPQQFSLYRQKDGQLRFLAAWSNNFTDRHGEIFPEYAHKEFIEWADTNQQYPELWIWHTKGTKYGQVDWLDYTDGFVYASGTIDAGFEDLALAISKEDSGVSHGFHGLQRGKEIVQYRSFEISTLPRDYAAVPTTSFNIIGEGAKEMAFTQTKKEYLKAHGLDDAAIAAAETQATQLSKSLNDLGISYKDADLVPDPVPVAPVVVVPVEGERAAAATTQFQSDMLAAINKQNEVLAALAGGIKAIDERVKSIEGGVDAGVAAAITARPVGVTVGAPASKSAENIVGEQAVSKDSEWFDKTFVSTFAGAGVS